VKRIRLEFAPGVETEFVDRDRALAQVAEWAERGTWAPSSYSARRAVGRLLFSGRRLLGCGSWGMTSFICIRWIGSFWLR
jgi:Archaeal ATPase.